MIFKAVGLVPFTRTTLRQRDQIDHTNRQEPGPEPNLKAQGFLLSRAVEKGLGVCCINGACSKRKVSN